jgi:hypothetical protein
MLVKMKRYEKLAGEHAKMFAKAWDYFCVATGAYLAGYRRAKDDAKHIVINQAGVSHWTEEDTLELIESTANEEIEVEFKDGEHQLSCASFQKWKIEIDNLSFKDVLKTIRNYDFEEIRVDEKDGLISFQGTARKK